MDGSTVKCPPDRHIAVEFVDLYQIVKGSLSLADRTRFEDVCYLIESMYQVEFTYIRRRIKENFLAFSTGAKQQTLITRKGKKLPDSGELNVKEIRFIGDFVELLALAHFKPLTKDEFETATNEEFLFHLPVEVNWSHLDKKMLTAYWKSTGDREALRRLLPDFSDKVLLFYRGVGVAHASDRYINEKIDLLVEYLVVNPFWWVMERLGRLFRRKQVRPPPPPISRVRSSSSHRNAKVIERRTLKRVLNSVWRVIRYFPWEVHLQEPTYKEVILLYRTKEETKKKKSKASKLPKDERLKTILQKRNVYVKSFADIPMADLEIIFPDKKVKLKPLSLINLMVTLVGALVGGIISLWQGGISLNVLYSSLSLVVARCGQVYSSMQQEKAQMMQDMSLMVYEKSRDAQEGVVSMLLEDMADQQLKEAVLVYSIAMLKNSALSEEELDKACEDFLEEHFGQKMDFAIEDALPRLVKWDLIRLCTDKRVSSEYGKYMAVDLEEARNILKGKWKTAYKQQVTKGGNATATLLQDTVVEDQNDLELTQTTSAEPEHVVDQVAQVVASEVHQQAKEVKEVKRGFFKRKTSTPATSAT